jgi:hypothetical protein
MLMSFSFSSLKLDSHSSMRWLFLYLAEILLEHSVPGFNDVSGDEFSGSCRVMVTKTDPYSQIKVLQHFLNRH